ncbi:MAG: hypothetical protein R3B95_10185 [Nitrospirales bacterium]|nr:hypothetical protein [Nitrospirales bacterium]
MYRCTEEDVTVVDIFGYEDVTVIQALLAYVTERSRAKGMMTLSIPLLEIILALPFQQLGFPGSRSQSICASDINWGAGCRLPLRC